MFNETPIKAQKCCQTLAKVLFLLYQGETLLTDEATSLFFSVTKLFQSKDTQLRRLVYLVIKELSKVSMNVIMATQSLAKDTNDRVAAEIGYRANAIRALCTVTDTDTVQSIERFIKQAIVDKDAAVSSSALVSAYHIYSNGGREVVKRWVNEVQEALNRPVGAIQYHALGLMYLIKQQDKMAVTKTVQGLFKGNILRSPYAHCMLIRYTYKVMEEDGGLEGPSRGLFEILENCLRHRYEMVNLEAARAICNLRGVTSKELFPVVSVLQLFLTSPRSSLRFAAIRTLNQLAMKHPQSVQVANLDMENLITDTNRSIATFAITTLLKTGNESSVDRLMKQITGFMSEITDEFKVIVVDAIRALCLKFPLKHGMMLQFLASCLRDEAGYESKKAVVEGIFDIIQAIPECKEAALGHLCEFIEDCEFTRLAVRILFLLGEEGPKMKQPTKFIRYIYNRTILENAPVRAAAVSALAKFAIKRTESVSKEFEEMKESIKILLNRCLDDPDDEVRDRAITYLEMLTKAEEEESRKFIMDDSTFKFDQLESYLLDYYNDKSQHDKPFDVSVIPVISKQEADLERTKERNGMSQFAKAAGLVSVSSSTAASAVEPKETVASPAAILSNPQLKQLGQIFKSSGRQSLSEDIAEYVVAVVKHVFTDGYILFQFDCKNTLDDVLLENVKVVMEPLDASLVQELTPVLSLPIAQLKYEENHSAFVAFKINNPSNNPIEKFGDINGSFSVTLKFVSKDCDPTTFEPDDEGYDDTYQVSYDV